MDQVRFRLAACLACMLIALPGWAQWPGETAPSVWWEQTAALELDLQEGKWRKVAKQAPRLGREMTAKSWFHTDLRRLFAEVSLFEAIALANLNQDDEAVWMWHAAQNLHRPIADRDLRSYGRAAKLLYEHPLRARGEIPFRWREIPRGPIRGTSLVRPKRVKEVDKPIILQSSAVKTERKITRPVKVEVIYDKTGQPHQPVLTFPPDVHPAVAWAVLRTLPDRPVLPARLDGEPIPYLTDVEHTFEILRGSSRTPDFELAS